ncbi:MAG: methionyl-tRNA formyltransferase [Crocinitomicaceae bacterium]
MTNRIVFMGTPDFAVESLKQLLNAGIEVAAVVTAPDRPAGRGQKLRYSAVKEYALENGLEILQPEKLKSSDFNERLELINADLFVVVAFRMLPEMVWSMPPLGTINLHGSLLPQYRGAAPINWAVINGEQETGATTFFIEKEIDTGKIIDNVTIPILEEDTAGSIHDKLMVEGAGLLVKTVNAIFNGDVKAKAQDEFDLTTIKHAPKIFKADCKIDWKNSTNDIFNKIRGLSPYPTAWTKIKMGDKIKLLKIFQVKRKFDNTNHNSIIKQEDGSLFFGTNDGWVEIIELQLEGKKRMTADAFLKGYDLSEAELVNE